MNHQLSCLITPLFLVLICLNACTTPAPTPKQAMNKNLAPEPSCTPQTQQAKNQHLTPYISTTAVVAKVKSPKEVNHNNIVWSMMDSNLPYHFIIKKPDQPTAMTAVPTPKSQDFAWTTTSGKRIQSSLWPKMFVKATKDTVHYAIPPYVGMKPGQLDITLRGTTRKTLAVPIEAISQRRTDRRATVIVVDGKKMTERVVTMGVQTGKLVEITKGIQTDEHVVVRWDCPAPSKN